MSAVSSADGILHQGNCLPHQTDCLSHQERLEPQSEALLRALTHEAAGLVDQFEPYDLVQLARHLAEATHRRHLPPQPELFTAIAKVAIPKLPEYGEKELSLLGWAFGKAHAKAWPLFDALAVRSAAECRGVPLSASERR